jgi:glycerol uptake facilitator-like aquaporin
MKYSEYKRLRNILLELFGTATIVYFTNWANLLYELKQVQLSTLGIIYGMVVSLMVYISQNRSGAHFDPAVTVVCQMT